MPAIVEALAFVWWFLIDIGRSVFGEPHTASKPLYFHNTLSGKMERFRPARPDDVTMYNCGPTVYGPQHIGNLSMYVFTDVLRRTLEHKGYHVAQVINITDVGHLSSDADEGDDKMTQGLRREGMELSLDNMRILAERYTKYWLDDIQALNVNVDAEFPRASDYISAQIEMVGVLEQKGYAYRGRDGVYFDTSKFAEYGKLGDINTAGIREGARVSASADKRSATDFLLWKLDSALGWESPWGRGFPGWHIECSAMIREILGDQIDIHTGGIEHIPIHHNNEIAQSESATGKRPFVRFWLHRAHLQIEGAKIAKSTGNTIYLKDLTEKGFHPLALRYLLLTAHYRQPMNFTWESLDAAQKAYLRLVKLFTELPAGGTIPDPYGARFFERISDDLDTPGALAILWEMVNDKDIDPENIRAGLFAFDRILGLRLSEPDPAALEMYRKEYGVRVGLHEVPERVKSLLDRRENARANKQWSESDRLRAAIEREGYLIKDTADGPELLAKY